MIPIENQVCTLHQGIELFNLGVNFQSLFVHSSYPDGTYYGVEMTCLADKELVNIPAYTVPELFTMCKGEKDLSEGFYHSDCIYKVIMDNSYFEDLDPKWWHKETPVAHGIADILIHLIKTKQILVEEINKL